MKQPYEDCPQFDVCSCNICPLDPLMGEKEAFPGEEICRAAKTSRLNIAKNYPDITLFFGGLTKRENMRKKASDRMRGLSGELSFS